MTVLQPPPRAPKRSGCLFKGCLPLLIAAVLLVLLGIAGGYFFVTRFYLASAPVEIPVQEVSDDQRAAVHERLQLFEMAAPIAEPTAQPTAVAPTTIEAASTPASEPAATPSQMTMSAEEINGLISANRRARGHASVQLSGNTATINVSVPVAKLTGAEGRYLNGSFVVETAGPTAPEALRVKQITANGWPVPAGIMQWQYRGKSLTSYMLDALAPYHIATVEIRDGQLIGTRVATATGQ